LITDRVAKQIERSKQIRRELAQPRATNNEVETLRATLADLGQRQAERERIMLGTIGERDTEINRLLRNLRVIRHHGDEKIAEMAQRALDGDRL
jgi:hypothetical protein